VTRNHANENSSRNMLFARLPAPTYDFFNRQYEKLEPLVSHRKQTTAPLSNRQFPALFTSETLSTSLRPFHFSYPALRPVFPCLLASLALRRPNFQTAQQLLLPPRVQSDGGDMRRIGGWRMTHSHANQRPGFHAGML
jgi:hypothetical protein